MLHRFLFFAIETTDDFFNGSVYSQIITKGELNINTLNAYRSPVVDLLWYLYGDTDIYMCIYKHIWFYNEVMKYVCVNW